MERLTLDCFKQMWQQALTDIKARENEFSRLDAIIGDGDHGTAIVQALQSVVNSFDKGNCFRTFLNEAGFNVMLQTSGSTSTLLGGFLLGMSDASDGTELNASKVKALLRGGLEGVKKNTKAQRGDKTMMDALIPAVEAAEGCESTDIGEIFRLAAKAAEEGAEATIAMKANFGRARNYGEKSIGSADSGATSWAAIFQAFAGVLQ